MKTIAIHCWTTHFFYIILLFFVFCSLDSSTPVYGATCAEIKTPHWIKTSTADDLELWRKKEGDTSSSKLKHEAVLLFRKKSRCEILAQGSRPSGKARAPYSEPRFGKAMMPFIEVVSKYQHGYTEELTSIYFLNGDHTQAQEVWSGVTLEVSPNGEHFINPLNWIHTDHFEWDKSTYQWNPQKRVFNKK